MQKNCCSRLCSIPSFKIFGYINDMDIGEIEQEQIDYIKRNGVSITAETDFPDPLKSPLDVPVVLTKEQEDDIIKKIREQLEDTGPDTSKDAQSITLGSFITTLSRSFVGIMEDLLNFDGNLETVPLIFTKENRMVFVASLLIVISLILLAKR